MYKLLIRPILFLGDPEVVHDFTFKLIRLIHLIPGVGKLINFLFRINHPSLERELFGLKFKNPIGLAAGFDKDAKLFNELSNFGFSFIEIGTLTPKTQNGNPKKRLFRLPVDKGLINRMGFNNEGVESAIIRLKKNKNIIIGGNIGKNKTTKNEKALDDYIQCFKVLYPYVHYFVVNVSSPNTINLRALQEKEPLEKLLRGLQNVNMKNKKPKPILLKISPDLNDHQLIDVIKIVEKTKIAGVIASNTTLKREELKSKQKDESGGLSGKPLSSRSTEVIRFLSEKSNKAFPIIGVGGIITPEDAIEKLNAGASLIQIYTGFIYEGPGIVKKISKAIINRSS